jgi:queuine tRNA-ribosyltransferase
MLTDSGGYQIFSLSKIRRVTNDGVEFRDPDSGKRHFFTPETVIDIQRRLGSDIMMVLDECLSGNTTKQVAEQSLALTLSWAKRSKEYFSAQKPFYDFSQALFGIVQGSRFKRLRAYASQTLIDLDFDGYAIGGVSVGEKHSVVRSVVDFTAPLLPEDKPRYLMGVGRPEDIVCAVKSGIDMFDCVIPTREARHARLYFFCDSRESGAKKLFARYAYTTVTATNARYATDFSPINRDSEHYQLRHYTKAYLHYLFRTQEMLAARLATLNNVEFYLRCMEYIQNGIEEGEI